MNIKRIFFALWPDHRQHERMRYFISPHTKLVEGKAVERSEWHVTLAYVGDLDVRFIPELMESARAIPFESFWAQGAADTLLWQALRGEHSAAAALPAEPNGQLGGGNSNGCWHLV